MRLSSVALALVCVVTGYALLGTRVKAVEDVSAARFPSGIGVGSHVLMWFSSDPKTVSCTIARIEAGWVSCAPTETDPFQKVVQYETWYNLAQVVTVENRDAKH